jgi:hypothetical protein
MNIVLVQINKLGLANNVFFTTGSHFQFFYNSNIFYVDFFKKILVSANTLETIGLNHMFQDIIESQENKKRGLYY